MVTSWQIMFFLYLQYLLWSSYSTLPLIKFSDSMYYIMDRKVKQTEMELTANTETESGWGNRDEDECSRKTWFRSTVRQKMTFVNGLRVGRRRVKKKDEPVYFYSISTFPFSLTTYFTQTARLRIKISGWHNCRKSLQLNKTSVFQKRRGITYTSAPYLTDLDGARLCW